jgi:hypothetical protein
MLGTSGGLSSQTRLTVMDDLRRVDKQARDHHWKREVHKAEPGPVAFQALRAHVPHHKPH